MHRDGDVENRSLLDGAATEDFPSMRIDDSLGHGQTEPGALDARGIGFQSLVVVRTPTTFSTDVHTLVPARIERDTREAFVAS